MNVIQSKGCPECKDNLCLFGFDFKFIGFVTICYFLIS